jgi:site-specific DNA-methyltransferase (adenine-specific)
MLNDVLFEFPPSRVRLLQGDCLDVMRTLPDESFDCCITSPPYFNLRDYHAVDQLGQEATIEAYIANLLLVFNEVKRLLKPTGSIWIVMGDSYVQKNRLLVPARLALALQQSGLWLRDEIVWHKPRTTPAPVKDRTVAAHEFIHMFTKQAKGYYYDYLAIEEPAKYAGQVKDFSAGTQKNVGNVSKAPGSVARIITVRDTKRKRSVWSISPEPLKMAHFATFPTKLIEPCVLAGCPDGGSILDPFGGSGTTGLVAQRHNRHATLIEINPNYLSFAKTRIGGF